MIKEITINHEGIKLSGHISAEPKARSWIIFAHGSGSSRKSSRNNWMANELNHRGHATLLFDLLTSEEDLNYNNRFNIPLLSERLELATVWLLCSPHHTGQSALRKVSVPVLLIVGSLDREVITLNEMAQSHLRNAELKLVEGATHLFEEPEKLGEVVELCGDWLDEQLNIYEGGYHVVT